MGSDKETSKLLNLFFVAKLGNKISSIDSAMDSKHYKFNKFEASAS